MSLPPASAGSLGNSHQGTAMISSITNQIGDDVLLEDPEGLESETERLFIGFGGLCLQGDPPLIPEALRKEFLNSRLTGPQSPPGNDTKD
jgi:hypothetical protein